MTTTTMKQHNWEKLYDVWVCANSCGTVHTEENDTEDCPNMGTVWKRMRAVSVFQLARMADCGDPSSADTYGGAFLRDVRDIVAENVQNGYPVNIHEIADSVPSPYTYQRLAQLIDLRGYTEDLTEYPNETNNIEKLAGVALYLIAERLVRALIEEFEIENVED